MMSTPKNIGRATSLVLAAGGDIDLGDLNVPPAVEIAQLTGFVYERPLASVSQDLAALGIEQTEAMREPEEHNAILCEVMAGLAGGQFEAEPGAQRRFFERHLKPWTARFFSDLETSKAAQFYKPVGRIGSLFMTIEAEAFAMDA